MSETAKILPIVFIESRDEDTSELSCVLELIYIYSIQGNGWETSPVCTLFLSVLHRRNGRLGPQFVGGADNDHVSPLQVSKYFG